MSVIIPANLIPVVGNPFCDSWNNRHLLITDIGSVIRCGPYVGRMVICDDGVGYDCFWSDRYQRFQYHTDASSDHHHACEKCP